MRLLRVTRRTVCLTVCVLTSLALTSPALADEGDDRSGASRPILGVGPDGMEDDEIGQVGGLATGPDGTVYVVDRQHDHIYVVDDDGESSIVAGSGDEEDDAGDGAPATDAHLESPQGITVTDDGTIYVAIPQESSIRAIDPDGTISTPFTDDDEWTTATVVRLGTDGTDVYAAVEDRGIFRVTDDDEVEDIVEPWDASEGIDGIDVAEDGTVYVASGQQVHVINEGVLDEVLPESWNDDYASPVRSAVDVAVMDDETLVIAGSNGLFRYENDRVTAVPSPPMGQIAVDSETDHVYFHDDDEPAVVWEFLDPGTDTSDVDLAVGESGSVSLSTSHEAGTIDRGSVSVDGEGARETYDLAVGVNGEMYVSGSAGFLGSEDDGRLPIPAPHGDVTDVFPGASGLYYVHENRLFEYGADGSITALSATSAGGFAMGDDGLAVASGPEISLLGDDGRLVPHADLSDESTGQWEGIHDFDSSRHGEFVVLYGSDYAIVHVRTDGELETVARLSYQAQGFSPTSITAAADGTVFIGGTFDENPEFDVPEDASMEYGGAILRVTEDGDVGTIAMVTENDSEQPPAPGLSVRLEEPRGLTLDRDGHLHFLDDRESYVLYDAADAPQLSTGRAPFPPDGVSSIGVMIGATGAALAAAAAVLRWIYVHRPTDVSANET